MWKGSELQSVKLTDGLHNFPSLLIKNVSDVKYSVNATSDFSHFPPVQKHSLKDCFSPICVARIRTSWNTWWEKQRRESRRLSSTGGPCPRTRWVPLMVLSGLSQLNVGRTPDWKLIGTSLPPTSGNNWEITAVSHNIRTTNMSPYCSCGVVQVSRRLGSTVCLQTATLTLYL